MTNKKALAEATKRWGKQAGIRHTPKATDQAGREAVRAKLKELRANKPVLRADLETRAEWDAHRLAGREWRAAESTAQSISLCSYRCTVGKVTWAFEGKGQGDTWEEAFAQADKSGRPPLPQTLNGRTDR